MAIARAIVGNPDIILADEPTGNLDSKMGIEVMDLLHQLNKEDGRTIVMVTHNEAQAKQTSRTVRFLRRKAGAVRGGSRTLLLASLMIAIMCYS